MKRTRAIFISHIMPALVSLFIGAGAISILDRSLPFIQTWGKIVPPTVIAGQEVSFHFELYKIASYGGTVHRWIVDAHGLIFNLSDLPTLSEKAPFNQATEMVRKFPVPCGISVGPAVYHSDTELYVWWNLVERFIRPLHNHVHYDFTVVPGFADDACAHGPDSIGPAGPAGPQGEKGISGVPGPAGPQGTPGRSTPNAH